MKLTNYQMIAHFLTNVHNNITPAKTGGRKYLGKFWASSLDARCRELRLMGLLGTIYDGRFAVFFLTTRGKKWAKKLLKNV